MSTAKINGHPIHCNHEQLVSWEMSFIQNGNYTCMKSHSLLAIINRKQNYIFDILYLSKHIKLFYIIYFNEDNSYKILKYKHTYKKK